MFYYFLSRWFYVDKLELFCGFTEKNDLLENGCSCTRNVAVNKWICRKNLIFVSPEFKLESIPSNKFFGIIADKYTDISNKELLSM